MDISQFPERMRAKALAAVVRSMRAGVNLRFGGLRGDVLPVKVSPAPGASIPQRTKAELEKWAVAACATLPYQLLIEVADQPLDSGAGMRIIS